MNDVADNNDVFSGSNYAKNYRKGRPTYPSSLIDGILTFLKEKVSDMHECSPLLIFYSIYMDWGFACATKTNNEDVAYEMFLKDVKGVHH